jgi:hypothetical protein
VLVTQRGASVASGKRVVRGSWLLDHNDADGQPAAVVASALNRTISATGELTRDEILDNITLYWVTNTGVSASRLYWEYKGGFFNAKGVSIPVAVSGPQGGDWGAFVVDQMGLQTSTRLSWPAARRRPVSLPRNDGHTSSSSELSSRLITPD